jgi:hypothetical protein
MDTKKIRRCLIYWMYALSLAHLFVGIGLPLLVDQAFIEPYHRSVEAGFWVNQAPAAARAQQMWWISLFGATIQNVAIWMAALTRLGDVHRSRFAWLALVIGVAVWAPQDMWISYTAGAMIHVWIDAVAVFSLVPPLLWLWWIDRKAAH